MKKIIAWMLCLAMLLGCCSALAEQAEKEYSGDDSCSRCSGSDIAPYPERLPMNIR